VSKEKEREHEGGSDERKGEAEHQTTSAGQSGASTSTSTQPPFVAKELLIDGGFEQANVGANTWTHQKTVGGWKSDSEVEVWGKDFYDIKATEGQKFAELDYDNRQSNIYQEVKTEAGTEYSFSFDYMKRPDSKQGSDTIEVWFNGKQVGKVDPTKPEWAKAEFKVVGTGGNDKIEFREEAGDNDSYGGLIDNASFKSTGRVEKEKAEKVAADKAAADKAAAEKAAAEKAAAEKAAAEKAAAEKAAAEKAAAEKAAADKAAAEKAAAEKAAAEKAAAEKASAEKAAAEKASAEKAAAEKAAAEKAAAEKAAAEKAAAEKAAAEKAAAEKAAAEKAAAEKAAADKAAADKAAADKATADQAAADKAAYDAAHKEDITLKTADASASHDIGKVINGTDGADKLVASNSSDQVYGGKSDDTITGVDKSLVSVKLALDGSLINAVDANAVSFNISGVPEGASLSAGAKNADGSWTLSKANLADLSINAKDGAHFELGVTVSATDGSALAKSGTIAVSIDSAASNLLVGGHGNDTLTSSGHGDDVIWGGNGPGKSLTHNTVADNDVIHVGDGHVVAYGQGGDDTIYGGKGAGVLNGGDGNDTIVAGGGDYYVTGGAGFDTIDFSKAGQGVNVDLHNHTATGFGNLTVKGMEAVVGSAYDDVLFGGKSGSVLTGGAGNDVFGVHASDAKAGAVTHITDFGAGDKLDLSEMLHGRTGDNNFRVTDGKDGLHVSVKIGHTFQDVAVLDGVHGQTAQDLLHHGLILA
jgi:Ca2+-binding RTX toxin-like protein